MTKPIENYSYAFNSNYNYALSDDRTQLTVTSDQDAFTARMHWPATLDVAYVASVMVGSPVVCEQASRGDETRVVYTLSSPDSPVLAARLAYEIAMAQRSELQDRLLRIPPEDEDEPTMDHLRRFPEWAEAESRVAATYAEAERLQRGAL